MQSHYSGMKLLLFILIIPWYLFPGAAAKDSSKVSRKAVPAESAATATPDTVKLAADTLSIADTTASPAFILDIPEITNVTLAMPLDSASAGNIDFYCGALVAARDMGDNGEKINLRAFDSSTGSISGQLMEDSDVFIGPIGFDEVGKALEHCPGNKVLVSPLDPRCREFTSTRHLVQVPASLEEQLRELARWAWESTNSDNGRLVVLLESADNSPDVIVDELKRIGADFSLTAGYMSVGKLCDKERRTIFITGSEKDYFTAGAVRQVSVLAMQHNNVSLFCPSRVRSLENLNVELIHSANVHLTTTYQVDYSREDVRNFVIAYRSLFRAEPNSFAFHGYDTMKYFTEICSKFGRQWYRKLPEFPGDGLQTGFRFRETESGMENVSVKRVIYNQDYSITIQ